MQGQNRCKCLDFSLWFLLLPIEHLNFQDVILTLVPVPGQETKQVRVSAHYDLVVLQGDFALIKESEYRSVMQRQQVSMLLRGQVGPFEFPE